MKDTEARQLVQVIQKAFPHVHAAIANQPGRSAEWSIVEVHAAPASPECFTLTSTQEWKRLQEIMQILNGSPDVIPEGSVQAKERAQEVS